MARTFLVLARQIPSSIFHLLSAQSISACSGRQASKDAVCLLFPKSVLVFPIHRVAPHRRELFLAFTALRLMGYLIFFALTGTYFPLELESNRSNSDI